MGALGHLIQHHVDPIAYLLDKKAQFTQCFEAKKV